MGRRHSERGTTLIELMIALVISSIAVAAAFGISFTVQGNYGDHRRAMRVESTARVALDVLGQSLRSASPGMTSGEIWDPCTGANVETIIATNQTDAPDSIEVIFASGGAYTNLTSAQNLFNGSNLVVEDNTNFENDFFTPAVVVDPYNNKAHLVDVKPGTAGITDMEIQRPAGCTTAGDGDDSYPVGAFIVRARRVTFSVQEPYLMMDPDGPGDEEPQAIGEGIEDMQLEYGVDLDDSGVLIDSEWFYRTGGALGVVPSVTGGQWKAIRITLTARSVDEVGQGAVSKRPAAGDRAEGVDDIYKRRTLSTIIALRNFGN